MSFNGAARFMPMPENYLEVVGTYGPTGYRVVDVSIEISAWILQQPCYQWKPVDDRYGPVFCDRYAVSDELYTLLVLRWAHAN